MGTAILPGDKSLRLGFEQPPPLRTDVSNDYDYATTPVRSCIACFGETFTFIWHLHGDTEENREESQAGRCQRNYEQDTLRYKLQDILFHRIDSPH